MCSKCEQRIHVGLNEMYEINPTKSDLVFWTSYDLPMDGTYRNFFNQLIKKLLRQHIPVVPIVYFKLCTLWKEGVKIDAPFLVVVSIEKMVV